MKAISCAALLLLAFGASAQTPVQRVMLAGDSTMATRTGYGDALCARLQPAVACVNLARGGRSSASFRAEGLWAVLLSRLRDEGDAAATAVLIQFGHNDQPGKPGRSTDLATEFPVNLARYVDDVRAAGALPVLVTPLSRRSFKGSTLHNDLQPWADAVRQVAAARQVPLLDLNATSAAAVQAMGEAEADTLAMAPPPAPGASAPPGFDHTHLGAKGAAFFAAMVRRDLVRLLAVPE